MRWEVMVSSIAMSDAAAKTALLGALVDEVDD